MGETPDSLQHFWLERKCSGVEIQRGTCELKHLKSVNRSADTFRLRLKPSPDNLGAIQAVKTGNLLIITKLTDWFWFFCQVSNEVSVIMSQKELQRKFDFGGRVTSEGVPSSMFLVCDSRKQSLGYLHSDCDICCKFVIIGVNKQKQLFVLENVASLSVTTQRCSTVQVRPRLVHVGSAH